MTMHLTFLTRKTILTNFLRPIYQTTPLLVLEYIDADLYEKFININEEEIADSKVALLIQHR